MEYNLVGDGTFASQYGFKAQRDKLVAKEHFGYIGRARGTHPACGIVAGADGDCSAAAPHMEVMERNTWTI